MFSSVRFDMLCRLWLHAVRKFRLDSRHARKDGVLEEGIAGSDCPPSHVACAGLLAVLSLRTAGLLAVLSLRVEGLLAVLSLLEDGIAGSDWNR